MSARDGWPVTLNGRRFLIDLAKYRRATVDAQRAMVDQSGDVGEQSLLQPGQWKRTGDDWSLGAGQEHYDIDESTSRRRFRASMGVDVWTRRQLTLLPDTTRVFDSTTWEYVGDDEDDDPIFEYRASTVTSLIVHPNGAGLSGTWLDAGGLRVTDPANPSSWPSPTYDEYNGPDTYIANQVDKNDTMVCSDGLWRYDFLWQPEDDTDPENIIPEGYRIRRQSYPPGGGGSGGDMTLGILPRLAGGMIAFAGGRLLIASYNDDPVGTRIYRLHELTEASPRVANNGVATLVWQFPYGRQTIDAIVGGQQGIYLATSTGADQATSTIHVITVDDATTALESPRPVAELPSGEVVRSLLYYQGFLIIGTNLGFRLAQIQDNGDITHGPLVRLTPATTTNIPSYRTGVMCLAARGQYVYFGWSNPTPTQTGVGRMDLARFTSPLVPAYATDLMTPEADGVQGAVTCMTFYRDRLYFAVEFDGVYGEIEDKVASGWLDTGRISYGTAEPKRFYSLETATLSNPIGASVAGSVVDAENNATAITLVEDTSDKFDRGDIDHTGEWMSVKLTLTRATSTTVSPTLTRWSMRAIPLPDRIEEIWLPIMVDTEVTQGDGPDVAMDPWTEFDWLKALLGARTVVPFTMGSEAMSVYVDGIYTGENDVAQLQWTDDDTWVRGQWYVKLVVVPASTAAFVTPVTSAAAPVDTLVFTYPGTVTLSTSPRWTPFQATTFTKARLLRASGSGTVTVAVKVGASTVETLTITDTGTDSGALVVDVAVDPGDILTVEVTGAGGTEDLTVVLG